MGSASAVPGRLPTRRSWLCDCKLLGLQALLLYYFLWAGKGLTCGWVGAGRGGVSHGEVVDRDGAGRDWIMVSVSHSISQAHTTSSGNISGIV